MEFSYQLPYQIPCDYQREAIYKDEVTAEAPAGTLHEAFFDPVTCWDGGESRRLQRSSQSHVVHRRRHIHGDLTRVEWSSNQVVLTLDPHVSLSGYVFDFIALDGSVSLSLFTDSATVDSAAGTYSWPMASQPWEDGDQLMVRIREG